MQKVEHTIHQIEYDLTAAELKTALGIPDNVEISSIQYRSKRYDPDRADVIVNCNTPSELHVTQYDPQADGAL